MQTDNGMDQPWNGLPTPSVRLTRQPWNSHHPWADSRPLLTHAANSTPPTPRLHAPLIIDETGQPRACPSTRHPPWVANQGLEGLEGQRAAIVCVTKCPAFNTRREGWCGTNQPANPKGPG